MITFDLDNVCQWGPSLSERLSSVVKADTDNMIRCRERQYFEDAAEILFNEACSKEDFRKIVQDWFVQQTIAAYHGSRLDNDDIEHIRKTGLKILSANDRKPYLEKKLRDYPQNQNRLGEILDLLGKHNRAGDREGQVHTTLSRSALIYHFNHYLRYGSEFDQHAAFRLIGDDYKRILGSYGKATLITLGIPGQEAFKAANPYGTLFNENLPNPLLDIARVWSNWLVDPAFSPKMIGIDTGMMFKEPLSPTWIESIETIDDQILAADSGI